MGFRDCGGDRAVAVSRKPTTTGQWSAVQSHSEPHRAVRDLRHRGHSSRWGTRHPRSGVSIKVLVTLRAPYSEQQRPTVREGGCARERMCPEVPTRMRRRQGSRRSEHAIRADGGRWAETVGAPHAHRGLRHSQQGGWRPTEQGAPRRSPRGLGRPLPVRTAPGRKRRFRRAAGLILPGGPSLSSPSRIILERINYEIVN